MALSVRQFERQIVQCGIMTADELSSIAAQMGEAAQSADELARELIQQKRLTKFQAQAINNGKGSSLALGNYIVLDKIGQGGMGQVFKAEHRRMKRIVALKVLPAAMVKDQTAVQRFQRELRAAARLSHPNIVAAFDADEAKGVHYYVMEYVDGADLSSLVRKNGPLTPERAVDYVTQAAKGLQYAHEQGIVHRDIKPSNLLVDRNGIVKVLDMGLARFDDAADAGAAAALTTTGAVMGTVDYMSPEQALDTKHADARSDVYSLGCTLWYLLIGRPLYGGDTIMKKLLAHRETEVPSLRQARGDVPPLLDGVFRKMVAKDPAYRYKSMAEVIAALAGSLVGSNSPTVAIARGGDSGDTALQDFFAAVEADAAPTLAAGPAPVVTRAETMQSGFLDQTMTGGLSRLRRSRRGESLWSEIRALVLRDKRVSAGAAALLVLLLLVGVALRNRLRNNLDGRQPDATVSAWEPGTGARSVSGASAAAPDTSSQVPAVDAGPRGAILAPASSGLSFDGVDDRVHIPSLRLDSRTITVEAWFRPADALDRSVNHHFVLVDGSPAWGLCLGRDNLLGFWEGGDSRWSFICQPTVAAREWTHVAGVSDAGKSSLFVNGRRIETQAYSGGHASPWDIGGSWLGFAPLSVNGDRRDGYFRGFLRDVRVSGVARYTQDFSPPASLALDDVTLALYRADDVKGDVLADLTAHGHDGKLIGPTLVYADGSPIREADVFALSFDGDGDYIEIPSLVYDDTRAATLEAWVRPQRPNDSANLFSWLGPQWISLYQTGRHWGVGKRSQMGTGLLVTAQEDVRTDEWTHVAGVYKGDSIRLYINGRQVGTIPGQYQMAATDGGLFIGGAPIERLDDPADQERWFVGDIREVRVSQHDGLPRYLEGFTPPAIFKADADTIALYRFNEGQGATLRDESGHGHDGKIVGAAWRMAAPDAAAQDFGLRFDGTGDYVAIPSLTYDGPEITLEARVLFGREHDEGQPIVAGSGGVRAFSLWGYPSLAGMTFIDQATEHTAICEWKSFSPTSVHDVAGVCTGREARFFLDGRLVATDTNTQNVEKQLYPQGYNLGTDLGQPEDGFDGTVAEVRISSVARYAGDYTPAPRFEADADTLALYHFDEGSGETLHDASGHGHDGAIVGATWVPFADKAPVAGTETPAAAVWSSAAERTAAEWVIRVGGTVHLRAADGELILGADALADLPTGPFLVAGVFLNAAQNVRDDDLARLAPLRRLLHLHLGNPAFTNDSLRHIRPLDQLQTLQTEGSRITESGLAALAALPRLHAVVSLTPPFVDNGLASLDALPHLNALRLAGPSAAEVEALVTRRALDHLRDLMLLTQETVSDDVVRRLQEGRPRLRVIINGETRGNDPVSPLAERLRQRGAGITVGFLNDSERSFLDSESPLPGRPFHVRNVRFPPGSPAADSDLRDLDQLVELSGLEVHGPRVTDAGIAELAECRRLVYLNVAGTSITDAAVEHLGQLTGLNTLIVGNTRLTAAGVERLHAALPDTNIRSDVGDFAPEWASP